MPTPTPAMPTKGPNARTVMALAWPMTLKAIMLNGAVVIDAYLISGLGEVALAALGLAAAIAGFVLGAILAFSSAMQLRTAQAFGTRDPVFLKSVLASGLTISLTIGAVGLAAIALFGGALIGAMAPTEQVAGLARDYLSVFSIVLLAEAIGQCLSSFFNGCGRTRLPLYSFCLAVPINVATSVLLIYGYGPVPAFGVTGAAMGSAIAVVVQVGFLGWCLYRLDGGLARVPGWRQASFLATLRRHIAFSWPIAATIFSAALATQVCALIYARLSLNAFAALTLIGPWIMVGGTIGMQWAQATGIIVAQILGARQGEQVLDRFVQSAWRGAFAAAAVVAAVYLALCLSAGVLYADLNLETRSLLLAFLPVLILLPFPKGSNAICGNTLRASGDTLYVMQIFLWAQWFFRVPATAIAVLYFDLNAVWVLSLLLVEEVLKLPAFHLRVFRGHWKRATIGE